MSQQTSLECLQSEDVLCVRASHSSLPFLQVTHSDYQDNLEKIACQETNFKDEGASTSRDDFISRPSSRNRRALSPLSLVTEGLRTSKITSASPSPSTSPQPPGADSRSIPEFDIFGALTFQNNANAFQTGGFSLAAPAPVRAASQAEWLELAASDKNAFFNFVGDSSSEGSSSSLSSLSSSAYSSASSSPSTSRSASLFCDEDGELKDLPDKEEQLPISRTTTSSFSLRDVDGRSSGGKLTVPAMSRYNSETSSMAMTLSTPPSKVRDREQRGRTHRSSTWGGAVEMVTLNQTNIEKQAKRWAAAKLAESVGSLGPAAGVSNANGNSVCIANKENSHVNYNVQNKPQGPTASARMGMGGSSSTGSNSLIPGDIYSRQCSEPQIIRPRSKSNYEGSRVDNAEISRGNSDPGLPLSIFLEGTPQANQRQTKTSSGNQINLRHSTASTRTRISLSSSPVCDSVIGNGADQRRKVVTPKRRSPRGPEIASTIQQQQRQCEVQDLSKEQNQITGQQHRNLKGKFHSLSLPLLPPLSSSAEGEEQQQQPFVNTDNEKDIPINSEKDNCIYYNNDGNTNSDANWMTDSVPSPSPRRMSIAQTYTTLIPPQWNNKPIGIRNVASLTEKLNLSPRSPRRGAGSGWQPSSSSASAFQSLGPCDASILQSPVRHPSGLHPQYQHSAQHPQQQYPRRSLMSSRDHILKTAQQNNTGCGMGATASQMNTNENLYNNNNNDNNNILNTNHNTNINNISTNDKQSSNGNSCNSNTVSGNSLASSQDRGQVSGRSSKKFYLSKSTSCCNLKKLQKNVEHEDFLEDEDEIENEDDKEEGNVHTQSSPDDDNSNLRKVKSAADVRLESKKRKGKATRMAVSCPALSELSGSPTRKSPLPTIKGVHPDLKAISPDTMADILRGRYDGAFSEFIIIDCRYPYEYEGGHIQGAVNLHNLDLVEENFPMFSLHSRPADTPGPALIFHCEFSSVRGPNSYKHLRKLDREANYSFYPNLCYPNMFILEGGYKAFYATNKEFCHPQAYVEMNDERFVTQMKEYQVANRRRSWKKQRAQSFAAISRYTGKHV
jgi:M-phase inducer phosphatase 2